MWAILSWGVWKGLPHPAKPHETVYCAELALGGHRCSMNVRCQQNGGWHGTSAKIYYTSEFRKLPIYPHGPSVKQNMEPFQPIQTD